MKIAICRVDDVSIYTRDGFGRRLGNGAPVDLDEVIGTHPSGEPMTIADALGRLVTQFQIVAPAQPSPVFDDVDDGSEEDQ